jgi:hypothetical protein
MLYKLDHILDDLIDHLENKDPFSILRLGDGDLKLLDELIRGKINPGKFKRSGIPEDKGKWVLNLYKNGCNSANYTSSFEMYNTDKFWNRYFSPGTGDKVRRWKKIYKEIGITNQNYCNPEIGHLLFLSGEDNLLKYIKGKRVCLITCFGGVSKRLKNVGVENINTILIPSINHGHYSAYNRTTKEIIKRNKETDIFLMGAGALGKGYAKTIKDHGGICIDIGQVMNAWAGKRIAKRFKGILLPTKKRVLFKLSSKAQKFKKFL